MRSSVRRWATPITLLVLLALLGFGLWWGWGQLTRPVGDQPEPCVTQSASTLTSAQVTVTVLNAGGTAGLAGQVTEQLTTYGFQTKSPGNSSEEASQTVVVGATADAPEVQLVTGFFTDAEARGDDRTDGTVDVILTDNYAGFNNDAPTEIEVAGGVICVQDSSAPPSDEATTEG